MGKTGQRGAGVLARRGGALLLTAALLAPVLAPRARAQSSVLDNSTTRSRSGQFAIRVSFQATPDPFLLTNQSLVHLDPAVVAVACERVKERLWGELGLHGQWVSRVSILLYPALSPDEVVTLSSDRVTGGWQYRMYLPEMVERGRYARAIVQVLLLEWANRNVGSHGAEIPTWLVEGLSQQLLASNEAQIILPAPESHGGGRPMSPSYLNARRVDPLTHAHEVLTTHTPLTFQDLSWPDDASLAGEPGEVYRGCAQLFVHRLLDLADGRACLRAMLAALPERYNWQFAFLTAFHSHFERAVDVEKWWAIQLAEFTGRSLDQTWAKETSLQKLDQALRASIQVRTVTNELPLHAEAVLQNVVRDWDPATQGPILQGKIGELGLLYFNASPEIAPLVEGYRQTLADYLRKRDKPGLRLPFRKQAVQRHNIEGTVTRLYALDARRQLLLRASLNPSPQAALSTNSGGAFTPLPPPSFLAR
jgi:hypothetical protein